MGWRALTNGALMKEAASRFEVLVTLDQNLRFQDLARSREQDLIPTRKPA